MMIRKMYGKILVTGGTGMVGKALRRLTMMDKRYIYVGSKNADLTDYDDTKRLFDSIKPNAVIHLAAVVGGLFYNMKYNAQMLDLNTRITINVTRCCVETNVEKVILVNSTCAFPEMPFIYPMTEKDLHQGPVHHSNEGYGMAKRISEVLGRLYMNSSNTKFVTVYPCNIYGIGDNFNMLSCHVLSSLLAKAHKCHTTGNNQEPLIVYGTGKPLRQFIYVDDVAKLLIKVLEQYDGSSMILCNKDDEISIHDLAKKICTITGISRIEFDTTKSDGLYRKTVSNKVLRKAFPDFQFTSLDDGIRMTYEWYVNQM